MNNKTNRVLMGFLIAMAVAASALVLTIPALFGPHEPHQFWLTAVLGGITAVLGIALILLRPGRNNSVSTPHN